MMNFFPPNKREVLKINSANRWFSRNPPNRWTHQLIIKYKHSLEFLDLKDVVWIVWMYDLSGMCFFLNCPRLDGDDQTMLSGYNLRCTVYNHWDPFRKYTDNKVNWVEEDILNILKSSLEPNRIGQVVPTHGKFERDNLFLVWKKGVFFQVPHLFAGAVSVLDQKIQTQMCEAWAL